MLPTSRWGVTGLTIGIFFALLVWAVGQAGWLNPLDGIFYDKIHSWTTLWREPESKELVVRLARGDAWTDAEGKKVLDVLEDFGAKAIVINFVPHQNSPAFFQRAAELKNVIFGRVLRPNPDNPDTLRLEEWPAAASDLDLPWGVVFLPPSVNGIHRWQQTQVKVGTNIFPTLENQAATFYEASTKPAAAGPFLINFAGGPGAIPNVSLSRVLSGELIADMVKGKVVLIGTDDEFLGLETPVNDGKEPMTFLEFQGNALQTLLDGTRLRPLRSFEMLVLMIALGIFSSIVYQRLSLFTGARVVIGVIVGCAAIASTGMMFLNLWIPLGSLLLAQSGQFVLTFAFKSRITNLALDEMRLRALNQIKERFNPQNALLVSEYWNQLTSMLNQTLGFDQMAFFDCIPQTRQLRETKAFNCKFEEMQEKNRTLDAPTFSQALKKRAPIRVSGFFKNEPAKEEYLCPLIFAEEVLGMWVVGINPARAAAIPEFKIVLMRFSYQIARTLYHKKRNTVKPTLAARVKAWLSAEKEEEMHQELRSTADLLEQYYDILDTVFSEISMATIVYDSFGHLLKANQLAFTLLEAENYVLTRGTALDFLRLITGKEESKVRQLLRDVLLEHTPVSMSVKFRSKEDRRFLLRVFPLSEKKAGHLTPDASSAQGMICELIETTSLSTLASIKGVVADRLGVELRNHLAAIDVAASLMETDLPPPVRQKMLKAIHYKTNMCVLVISECQKYLGRDVDDVHALQCFPVDSLQVLDRVCAELAKKAARRRVTFKAQQPRLMPQVLASTDELAKLFSTCLELLLRDAAENTALTIAIENSASSAVFRLSNCGFGIPNERLQDVLTSPEAADSGEFQVLREAAGWIRIWEGSLKISSDIGKGYSIILQLRLFPSTPPDPSSTPDTKISPGKPSAETTTVATSNTQQSIPEPITP